VIYGIDADHLTVWIEHFDGSVAYRAGVLCRRHADAMVVPLGWVLDDRRETAPRLFTPRDEPAPVRQRQKRHKVFHGDDTAQLELTVPPELADDDVPVAVPERATPASSGELPWKPVFDQSDDLGGLLTAESPLLSRAFGRRQRPSS
jgi:hypothetical protein